MSAPKRRKLSRGRKSAMLTAWNLTLARRQSMQGHPVMRMHLTTLVVMALAGYCSQANAQDRCPELTRLRSEAAQVINPITSVAPSDRCGAYIRFAMAWGAIAQYANDHRESCDISSISLSEVEQCQREAEKARENVCAGRPLRPFPPDVIKR
jgi:hypothetical protein